MTTLAHSRTAPVSFKVLPMTLGLGAFAAVLVPLLFAVSGALGFRNGGWPGVQVPVSLAAVVCLVGLPCVWAAVSHKGLAWGLAAVFAVGSVVLLDLARDIYPYLSQIKNPLAAIGTWLPVTLGIMLAAGWLGIFMRSAWKARRWTAFGFLVAGYGILAVVGWIYTAIPLFFE